MIAALLFALLLQAGRGTATVRGSVVAADNGNPVKYAAVQIVRGTGTSREIRTVVADSSGVFEIGGLDPGTYTMVAAKLGFTPDNYHAPSDDTGRLKLVAGQVESGVKFRLTRASVISGKVLDSYGDPVVSAQVQLSAKRYSQGRPLLSIRRSVQTDDRGEYRLYGLDPGRYYVQASKNANIARSETPLAARMYPNATRLEDAQAIVVKAGEEREDVNLTLPDAVLLDVRGYVIDAESGRARTETTMLNFIPFDMGVSIGANAQTRPDGSFHVSGVTPGRYRVMANLSVLQRTERRFINAMQLVELNAGNAGDLVIRVGAAVTVNGTLKVDGAAPAGAGALRVVLSEYAPDGGARTSYGAGVDKDGAFKFENVTAGRHELLVVLNVPNTEALPFFVSRILQGDHDVTDSPIEVGDSGQSPLSVTIDYRPAAISGKVLDESEKPVARVNVALISADPKKRLVSRYFYTAASARDGSYKLSGIVPGDYLVIPWSGDDSGQLLDPDVFAMAEKLAIRVTLGRGAAVVQDVHFGAELKVLAATFAQ